MKRFLTALILLLASLPVGVSLLGCGSEVSHFCDASETVRTNQVVSVVLQPQFSTLSLAYTQTRAMAAPAAYNCLGVGVGVKGFDWTSSNPSVLDVSPSGVLCSGTWNRNSGGGIGDFTICSAPSTGTIESLLQQGGGTYSAFHVDITASANGVASNPVTVYSHPQVTTAFGYTVPGAAGTQAACSNQYSIDCTGTVHGTEPAPQCYSQQGAQAVTYCAVVCAEALGQNSNGTFTTQLVDVTGASGDITFAASNANVVLINPATVAPAGVATPIAPGATLVTASVSGVTAAAGVWSTCAPATMQLSVPNSTDTTVSVPINQPQTLTLTATDSKDQPVNLFGLTFTSTTPRTLGITQSTSSIAGGIATPIFGGSGDVYAACLPPGCNPSPINEIGLFATAASGGNGVPLTSNPINVVTPGTETSIAYLANFDAVDYPNANYFAVYDSQENSISVVSTPFRPNSMVLSQDGTRLYLGSDLGLMVYPVTGTTVGQVSAVQIFGRVLAVSPDDTTVIVASYTGNTPAGGQPLIVVYAVASGAIQQFGGTAYSAQWSADGNTAYIAGGNQEYVYSKLTGFASYAAPASEANALDVAVLAPAVGAFYSGTNTEARSYCPNTVTNPPVYNPLMTPTGEASERLGLSADGLHLFSAVSSAAGNFNDFCIGIPTTAGSTVKASCAPAPVAPLAACSPAFAVTAADTPATAAVPAGFSVTGIPVATTLVTPAQSNPCGTSGQPNCITYTAFVTYSNCVNTLTFDESCPGNPAGTGTLPYYADTQGSAGTVGTLTLTDPGSAVAPIAPTAAAVSPDSTLAFVATSGDNALHIVSIGAGGVPTENVVANPPVAIQLPSGNSTGFIPVDKIVIKPYRAN